MSYTLDIHAADSSATTETFATREDAIARARALWQQGQREMVLTQIVRGMPGAITGPDALAREVAGMAA